MFRNYLKKRQQLSKTNFRISFFFQFLIFKTPFTWTSLFDHIAENGWKNYTLFTALFAKILVVSRKIDTWQKITRILQKKWLSSNRSLHLMRLLNRQNLLNLCLYLLLLLMLLLLLLLLLMLLLMLMLLLDNISIFIITILKMLLLLVVNHRLRVTVIILSGLNHC